MSVRTEEDTGAAPSVLRTYWWLVALVTAATVGVAVFAAGLRPVSHTATATVLVEARPVKTGQVVQPSMGTEAQIVQSGTILAKVADDLGVGRQAVQQALAVDNPTDTTVLSIGYSAPSDAEALKGATAFTTLYVSYRDRRRSPVVAHVITPATVGSGQATGSYLLIAVGLVAGLLLGIAAAFGWDRVVDRVRSPDELRESGVPVLGGMRLPSGPRAHGPPVQADTQTRLLAARISARVTSGTALLVTGARPIGSSVSVAEELAVALAATGHEVVYTDPLRSPSTVAELFGHPSTHAQAGAKTRPTGVTGLTVLDDHSDMGIQEMQKELRDRVGRGGIPVLVVEAAPVLQDPHTVLLASSADLVLLAADLRHARRRDVRDAVATLGHVQDRILGWVTCRVTRRA